MKFWTIALLLLCPLTWAGVDKVGQGAGISENNISFAYENLDKYLELCLAIQNCVDAGPATDTLKLILAALPSERAQSGQIVFKSQSRDQIFFIDGKVRVAKTFTTVGSPIFFNLDQLYSLDSNQKVVGISIPTAIALLVHEFGHHQGILNHDWLDTLGHKVAKVMESDVHSGILSPEQSNIEVTSINLPPLTGLQPRTQVLLSDGPNLYDLEPAISANFKCPQRGGIPSSLSGLELWNFSWHMSKFDPILVAYAKPYCRWQTDGSLWSPTGFGVQIQVHLVSVNGSWTLDPAVFYIRQATCATEPLLCGWDLAYSIFQKDFVTQPQPNQHQPKDLP